MKLLRAVSKALAMLAILVILVISAGGIVLVAFGLSFLMPVVFAKITSVLIFIFFAMVYLNYDSE